MQEMSLVKKSETYIRDGSRYRSTFHYGMKIEIDTSRKDKVRGTKISEQVFTVHEPGIGYFRKQSHLIEISQTLTVHPLAHRVLYECKSFFLTSILGSGLG